MKIYGIIVALLLTSIVVKAQRLQGTVNERTTGTNKILPLTGANVYWSGSSTATVTDSLGHFTIPLRAKSNQLVVSFVGFLNDTIKISGESEIQIILTNDVSLEEVTIRENASTIDRLSPHQTEIITTRTLAKAACCNLSESFETNAAISVSSADAVTGSKQIQMLGLNGKYIQTNVENIPNIRGLAATFGMNFIPGTWIQSIDIGKGAGSVVSGYESMTGQINVELQKPDTHEKLYLNTYVNSFGRGEINLNLSHQLNKKWSTSLLSHGSALKNRMDKNQDGFLDLPLYNQVNFLNRWKYQSEKYVWQFGAKVLSEDRLGGQNDFKSDMKGSTAVYGFGANINRYEFFSKLARLFPNKPYKGLGWIVNATSHDSKSYFGTTDYNGRQNTFYTNLIYQSIIGSTNHSFKTGLSYLMDQYKENYGTLVRNRNESVPGAFFEYTYNHLDKFVAVAGGRVDVHNLYGTQWTPRLHLKYSLTNETALRASVGKGFRVANPFAEYYGNLVSSRTVQFLDQLRPEVSWSFGASLTHDYTLGNMKGNFIVDYYRTNFVNKVVADFEDYQYLKFYNLNGTAYANSFQAEANLNPLKRFDLKFAYRLFDVRQSLQQENGSLALTPQMMISRHRILFNAEYALPYDKWKFDATLQWNGRKRLVKLGSNEGLNTNDPGWSWSPTFINLNAQITRTFPKWDIYLGGENLSNFRQNNPIFGANDPFGKTFDASMAWGPITGRMVYLGVRYKMTR